MFILGEDWLIWKRKTIANFSCKNYPLYKKVVKVRKKFTAHDENNEAKVGDTVRIAETRPLSKNKCWRLLEIISRAVQD